MYKLVKSILFKNKLWKAQKRITIGFSKIKFYIYHIYDYPEKIIIKEITIGFYELNFIEFSSSQRNS